MSLEEKIKKVKGFKETVRVWKNDFNSEEYKLASSLNNDLFGLPLNRQKNCDCVNDLLNYITQLNSSKINQIKEKMESKFKLKKGTMIMVHGIDMQLTEANLTDEKAITLLKKYPKHIISFEVYPENWEELVIGKPKKDVAPDKDEEVATERVFKPRSTGKKRK